MNIIVCIKQVPNSSEVKLNQDTHTIIREANDVNINPFDRYALEEGVRLKERLDDAHVTTLSMGIPSVEKLLKETIGLGADEAILLSDKTFSGADTLATAITLEGAIRKIGDYGLIICGRQSIDGDTAQVGPSLAQKLGISSIANVKEVIEISETYIKCKRLTDVGYDIVTCQLPALITVVKDINEPRMMNIKGMMASKKAIVPIWSNEDLNIEPSLCGLQGSPTQLVKTYKPSYERKNQILGGDVEEQVRELADLLTTLN